MTWKKEARLKGKKKDYKALKVQLIYYEIDMLKVHFLVKEGELSYKL